MILLLRRIGFAIIIGWFGTLWWITWTGMDLIIYGKMEESSLTIWPTLKDLWPK
jgi:hypothetical protein